MQLFNTLVTAITLAFLPLLASANDHLQGRNHGHHQGLSRRAEGHVLHRRFSNSKWSWYDTETGQAGSCGRHLHNYEFVVAMNAPQADPSRCFNMITMSWQGKTTQAQIVDTCPGCPWGGLDLSPSLFQFFSGLGTGIIWDGEWWFEGEGPAPPPPPPPPTTEWVPPPPTTTEWVAPPTTTSSWVEPTTSSTSTSSSSSTTSSSAVPSPTVGNLGDIFQIALSLADLTIDGGAL